MIRRLIGRALWGSAAQRVARDADRAVVHEWLTALGGSDKCAAELATIARADALFVFALDDALVERVGVDVPVHTWRLGRWVARFGRLQLFLPIMPIVWWSLDLAAAKLVVTSSHCMTNSVRAPEARVVCYCYTPMRYAWNWRLEIGRAPGFLRPVVPVLAACLRRLDRRQSRNVDTFVAISGFVRDRISQSYDRDAIVVFPAVDVAFWAAATEKDRAAGTRADAPFLVAGRLVAYKQTAVAVQAATLAAVPLVVAGAGPELERLRSLAGPTVSFPGSPDDGELRRLLASSRALLFPGIEDFGMLPVEAQAAGTPVVARGSGGALETVIDGVTGVHVASDDPHEWADVLRTFDRNRFEPGRLEVNAESFATEYFAAGIDRVVHATESEETRP